MSPFAEKGSLVCGLPEKTMWAVRARQIMTMQPDRPVLDDGMVLCLGERIMAVDTCSRLTSECSCQVLDLGDVMLAPGLMNSHVHLELSHLRGAVTGGQGFAPWVRSMLAQSMSQVDPDALGSAVQEMRDSGTVYAADVATRRPDLTAAAMARELPLFHVLVEFIGHGPLEQGQLPWPEASRALPEHLCHTILAAGHALYSTSPELLKAAKTWCDSQGKFFSIHLAEHADEEESLLTGSGEFHDLLARSLLPRDHVAPGLRPVALAHKLGLLDRNTLAVHCVRVLPQEIDLLAELGVSICLCPRSNAYIGVGRAPWEAMRDKGIRLCLGTDSLASNHDLDLWNEVRFLLEISASHITLPQALAWMTVHPAQALGLEAVAGTLAPGKIAAMSVVPQDMTRL